MYGEDLRNWGLFLLCMTPLLVVALYAVYFMAGRWLRKKLDADYGKVCALPRTRKADRGHKTRWRFPAVWKLWTRRAERASAAPPEGE